MTLIRYESLPKSLESKVFKLLKQLNYFLVVWGEDARLKMLPIVQVHCVAPAWRSPEDKRFIIALHKLGNKFAVIYWLNIWTWLQQRNRLELCMADFGLEGINELQCTRQSVYACACITLRASVFKTGREVAGGGDCSLFNIEWCWYANAASGNCPWGQNHLLFRSLAARRVYHSIDLPGMLFVIRPCWVHMCTLVCFLQLQWSCR